MIKRFLVLTITSLVFIISGCSSPPPPQPVVVTPTAPQPSQNKEMLKALAQLAEIKQELKSLRNTMEELQFETENSKRRQQDLFQDLDRRLVGIERNERVISQTQNVVAQPDSNTGTVLIGDSSTTSTTTQATDVVVVDSASSESTSSDASIQSPSVVAATSGSVTLDEQNAYEQAFNFLKQSRYEDAVLGFQALVDTWPSSQLADDSFYWMSEARYVNREFEYALSGFRTVVSKYPDSQRVPEALLKIGYIQYDIGDYDGAAETFRDILARFPGHQVTVSAQTRLRRIEQTIQ